MSRYAQLPELVRNALANIEPSEDGDLSYCPSRITLRDGVVCERQGNVACCGRCGRAANCRAGI